MLSITKIDRTESYVIGSLRYRKTMKQATKIDGDSTPGTGKQEQTTEADDAGTTPSEQEDPPPENGGDLPLDVVFGILKNRRRRLVLRYLVEVSETSTLSDLAEHIAALENDKPEKQLTSSERKRVYVCLYQCHLPKMDDAGVIDFETSRGTVVLNDDVEEFTQYLETGTSETESSRPRYYMGLAVICGGLFLAQQLFYPSALASGIAIGLLIGLIANLGFKHAHGQGLLRYDGDGAPNVPSATETS